LARLDGTARAQTLRACRGLDRPQLASVSTVPRIASFPPPRIARIASIPDRPLNITELQMIVHTGTHVDSPRHFYNDGPAFQDIPLERLMGQGWYGDCSCRCTA